MIRDLAFLWRHDRLACAAALLPCASLLVWALHGAGIVDLATWDVGQCMGWVAP
jgi:hypothetical protein